MTEPATAVSPSALGTRARAGARADAVALGGAALRGGRQLPVAASLRPLLPVGGLVRGTAVATRGRAALSTAMALIAEASAAGSWTALVDPECPPGAGDQVPLGFGLEAAEGYGIALERVVRVRPARSARNGQGWAEAMAAVLDGFELVVTAVGERVGATHARRVRSRLQRRDGVVVVVGAPGAFPVDLEVRSQVGAWEGLGTGSGHLQRRRIELVTSGRRSPRPASAELWLPGDGGCVIGSRPPQIGYERALLDPALDGDGGDHGGVTALAARVG